jgi:hypothetical protein
MKRLLLALAFVFVAAGAFADIVDRDVLITDDGTVYSILSGASDSSVAGASLTLTVQSGGKTIHSVIPETVDSGFNTRPALAYDADSKTLFVMWLRFPNAMSSEILLSAYQNGKWQKAVSIDADRSYAVRYNLSVGITRRVQQVQKDGSLADVPALVLHAVWWEANRSFEGARYAVMSVDKGVVSEPDIHDMTEFIAGNDPVTRVDDDMDRSFFRHVAILDGPTSNAVDVLFADQRTNNFYRTTLRPIADGRVHITIGVRGGPVLGGPRTIGGTSWSGRTGTVSSPDGSTVILCSIDDAKISYVKVSGGHWSAAQQVALTDQVTAEAAMAALARMAANQ